MRSGRFGVVLLWATVALADDDGERVARVIHEIDALKPLIAEAEAQANPDACVKFHYPWLKQDLEYIKLGIREHIETPRPEPRSFPALIQTPRAGNGLRLIPAYL
jgi:RAQPRD family integrative conjugative element protein